ncbi:MAG: purine-nucleoside phosphorylase [Bacteroidales bacterium]|nr:purine-nucleoside phosphorylase [Lentimicrobiaceae bacterium]MDD5694537.1 purine-nucleoside phosphorylase [Bacteroidales bacterium]
MWEKVNDIADSIRSTIPASPKAGIVLGTGLGGLVGEIAHSSSFSFAEIRDFPVTSVEGHAGKLIFGTLGNKEVVVMQGRIHAYEGVSMQDIVLPIRVMHRLGIRLLILTNASGGLNPILKIGDLMLVTDQINLMNSNPLIGKYDKRFGDRFPDMSEVFDKSIISRVMQIARAHQVPLQSGILAAATGPTFETRAEYAYMRFLGADAVGMSIIPEAIAARQLNLPCLAITVISDLGIPDQITKVSHAEVQQAASRAEPLLTLLIKKLLEGWQ